MIHVARSKATADLEAVLNRRNRNSQLSEREAAIWFHEDTAPALDPLPAKPTKEPDFAAYSDDVVKTALNAVFEHRCAYCESRYEHVSPMDVEHYRPKGGVIGPDGKIKKPGYYWLAADWGNLLPSCIGCNRAREQPQTLDDGRVVDAITGKANLFPLVEGTLHATKPGGEAAERPLLLDPCRDQPAPHLVFRPDGYVEPRRSDEEAATPRGLTTIEVCGLDRAALVEMRRKAATRLRDAMQAILAADRRCRRYPDDKEFPGERAEAEASLATLVADLDYRALVTDLVALFDRVRPAADLYARRRAAWDASRVADDELRVLEAARALVDLHARAAHLQAFVEELYGLADLPIARIRGADQAFW